MTAPACVRCGRPTADGYACMDEMRRARGHLATVADMTPPARSTAYGQDRRSASGVSQPASGMELNLAATARLDAVQAELVGWVRHIEHERGAQIVSAPSAGRLVPDPIIACAEALTLQLEWLRHRSEVDEFLSDVQACARVVAGVARGMSESKYLGPCGAYVETDVSTIEPEHGDGTRTYALVGCEGDIYVRVHDDGTVAGKGACRTCGAQVDSDERRKWLDEQVGASDLAWTARGIADALGLNPKTLRSWATERRAPNGVILRRARLATYWHNGEKLVPWVEPREGEDVKARGDRLHYVADVVELANESAERREAERARRAITEGATA
jgi:hypothetical protein